MRATRRLDQMRQAQKETVGLATGGDATRRARGIENPERKPTLAEAGIDKNLAKEGRKLGALSDTEFETAVAETRGVSDTPRPTLFGKGGAVRFPRLVRQGRSRGSLDPRRPVGARHCRRDTSGPLLTNILCSTASTWRLSRSAPFALA